MFGSEGYIYSAYSESSILITPICEVIAKTLILILIGLLYDCVSYAVLKKV